jgi:hypothetical protein
MGVCSATWPWSSRPYGTLVMPDGLLQSLVCPTRALAALPARYLSFHFPFIHERALMAHLRACPWRLDQGAFKVSEWWPRLPGDKLKPHVNLDLWQGFVSSYTGASMQRLLPTEVALCISGVGQQQTAPFGQTSLSLACSSALLCPLRRGARARPGTRWLTRR